MSITITDPALLAQLQQAEEGVELKDGNGNVLGTLFIRYPGSPPPGFKSPFTDEQRAERMKQRTGRPLKDIIRDLESRG